VYRHGTPRDCMPKFEDFKFCMSIKGLSEERRDEPSSQRASRQVERQMGTDSSIGKSCQRGSSSSACLLHRDHVWLGRQEQQLDCEHVVSPR
jgi:hypothetical protein